MAKTTSSKSTKKPASKTPSKAKSSSSKTSAKTPAKSKDPLAIELLKQDHREVEGYFEQFEKAESDDEKADLARRICLALTVHAQIEEEIFYPEARVEDVEDDLLDEAYVEHASAKELIRQIEGMKPGDEYFDAKVTVLGEYVKHHVEEEEKEMFPQARKSDMDLDALGEKLQARKQELMGKLGG